MEADHARSSTGAETAAATAEDPYPGLFRRFMSKKVIQIDGTRLVVEFDTVVASPRVWKECAERNEGGWAETAIDGVIVAERSRV